MPRRSPRAGTAYISASGPETHSPALSTCFINSKLCVSQKPLRRKIGKLATAHGLIRGHIPEAVIRQPRKLYEAFSSLTGRNVTRYGDLPTASRSEKPIEAEYLRHLYGYAGSAFQSKPCRHQEWRTPDHVREERVSYCQRMRDWRNAVETVNWLRAQLVSFENCQEDGNGLS